MTLRAHVIGSGPNGLTAAAILAENGIEVDVYERNKEIGGAAASTRAFDGEALIDLGAAAHPFAYGSMAFRHLDLRSHGLSWDFHDMPLAHPLNDAPSVFLHQTLAATTAQFAEDRKIWTALHAPFVKRAQQLLDNVTGPLLRVPPNPVLMARFGLRSLPPTSVMASSILRSRQARALFSGTSAHSMLPQSHPFTSGFGIIFGSLGSSWGWPVAHGGTGSIVQALGRAAQSRSVRIHTGHEVKNLGELPSADITILDLTPRQILSIAPDRLPARYARQLSRWRYGTAVYKVDYLLDGPIPWTDERTQQACTVHVGGDAPDIAWAEGEVNRGRMPDKPFVMVVQPSSADATRAPEGKHVVWSYAHVPNGYAGRAGALIDAQIERFAPGFGDRVLSRRESSPADLERWNPNLIGGDIGGGSLRGLQQFLRPTVSLNPYRLAPDGLYVCSSSTPPGGGVHGMGGWHAALAALQDRGIHPAVAG